MSFTDPLFYSGVDSSNSGVEDIVASQPEDQMIEELDPFQLDVSDDILVSTIDDRIEKSRAFYDKHKYGERRKRNRRFLFGDQIDGDRKGYESKYVDNVIYEAENSIKPIAFSRLPDLFVKPGSKSDQSKKAAEDLTKIVNNDIRKREVRKVLNLAWKHQPVFFQGVIKAVWDRTRGPRGDYRFVNVHPDNLVADHYATTNSDLDMEFIAEKLDRSGKDLVMMFPEKKEEILQEIVGRKEGDSKNKLEAKMASKYKIWECWFTYYKGKEDPETGERKFEEINAVVWKYNKMILGKTKNPYYDFEGSTRLFTKEPGGVRELTQTEVQEALLGSEQEVIEQKFYNNYFSQPRKPYIFLNYDQFGEHPLDYTSRIEQVLSLQHDVNKRGKQIDEMNDRAKGKSVFNAKLIDKETVAKMDMNDPDEDVMVTGNVNEAHTFIPGQPAPQQLFEEQDLSRNKIFQKEGVNSTTRGVREGPDTATSRQLFKEADFGKIDDMVEDMINYAAEMMAAWSLQFIKLFYTQDHLVKILGKDSQVTFVTVNQDLVEDGQEVVTSASGVDKAQLKRDAFERARLQFTDPMSFYKDTGADNPVERTKLLLLFMAAPELYIKTVEGQGDTIDLVSELQKISQQQVAAQAAPQAGATPAPAQMGVGGGGMINPLAQSVQQFMANKTNQVSQM